jgi:hypothetical protein
MLDWLLAPIDALRPHEIQGAAAWHARLMILAWGGLVPCGILAARFLKLWPGQNWPQELDHPGWWHLHRGLHYLTGALTLIALGLILLPGGSSGAATTHRLFGWSVAGLAALQFASAWLRGSKGGPSPGASDGGAHGDHYAMTPRRRAFEYIHKFGGYLALFGACGAIASGLWHANAPRWMWLMIGTWWLACLVLFGWLQRRGLAFDTYQAHWGSDLVHPGNRRRPIGFGIRRRPAASAANKAPSR